MDQEPRRASLTRKTKETEVLVRIDLDGSGQSKVSTGIGFLDHMLDLLACHSGFDIECKATGDLYVDQHHTVEDLGMVMGKVMAKALGDKRGIERFGDVSVPMQESLAQVSVDLSGRPHLTFNAAMPCAKVGDFDSELVNEFLEAFAIQGLMTIHLDLIRAKNTHHAIEAIFKGLARALRIATRLRPDSLDRVPSTKGTL